MRGQELGIELLLVQAPVPDVPSLVWCSRHVPLEGGPKEDPDPGELFSLSWPRSTFESSQKSCKTCPG